MKESKTTNRADTPRDHVETKNHTFKCEKCGRQLQTGVFDADGKKEYRPLIKKAKEYLTEKEACKYLHMTREQLCDALTGRHNAGRLTPTVRFEKKEVERYRQALRKAKLSFRTGEMKKMD